MAFTWAILRRNRRTLVRKGSVDMRSTMSIFVWVLLAVAICFALYALNQRVLVEWAVQECGPNIGCIVDMSLLPPFG